MKANKVSAIMGNEYDGRGLGELTAHRPLATLHFDCKYRLMDFSLSNLVNANIQSIYMVFSEAKMQSLFDHIGGGREWHLNSILSHYFMAFQEDIERKKENNEAYFDAMIDFLKKSKSTYTVYVGNKMLCSLDFRSVIKVHEAQQAECTIVFKRVSSKLIYETDHVLSFNEEGAYMGNQLFSDTIADQGLFNLGMNIFVVKTEWLIELLEKAQQLRETTSLEKLLWETANETTETTVGTYEYTGYLSNIHTTKSFYDANMDMLDPRKFNALLYSSQHIITKAKNEVPTYFSKESDVHSSQFATGSTIRGTVHKSLVSRRSTVDSGAIVEGAIVMANGHVSKDAEVRYAILDKNVTVQEGVRIVGTPAQPIVIKKGTIVTEDKLVGDVE